MNSGLVLPLKVNELTYDAALTAPVLTSSFDPRVELADILVRGVNHSPIHNLQDAIQTLGGCGTIYSMIHLTEDHPVNQAIKNLYTIGQMHSAPKDSLTCEMVFEMYKAYLKDVQLIEETFSTLKSEILSDPQMGESFYRALDLTARVMKAQVALAEYNPETLNAVSLSEIAARNSTEYEGKSIAIGFLRTENNLQNIIVKGNEDLLDRLIVNFSRNSYTAFKDYEKQNEINSDRDYFSNVRAALSEDGRAQLILEDTCRGMPEKYLAPDVNGMPSRPYVCSRDATSKTDGKGGVGNCELYYTAKAMGAELNVENYYDDPNRGPVGVRVTLTFPRTISEIDTLKA